MRKKLKFATRFTIAFLLVAFFDEALTFQVGSFYLTPLKIFSVYAFLEYLAMAKRKRQRRFLSASYTGFILLYGLVLISLVFLATESGNDFTSLLERFFHYLSSLAIIAIFIVFFTENSVDMTFVCKLLIGIYFLELAVSFSEMLTGKSLINIGVVSFSPLKIRGFHGDRIFLAEYLSLGWFLLYIKTNRSFVLLVLCGIMSIVVAFTSGSNTAIILFIAVASYIAYSLKSKFQKLALVLLAVIAYTSYSMVQHSFLSDYDLYEISKRNEMYYQKDITANTNWRLYAIAEIAQNFVTSPTLFGHGYGGSSLFLEKKSGSFIRMKPHNIISVLYDYGLVGGIFALILIIGLLGAIRHNFLLKNRTTMSHLSFIFSVLILSRLLFYYHTTVVWIYIFGIPVIVANIQQTRVNNKSQ